MAEPAVALKHLMEKAIKPKQQLEKLSVQEIAEQLDLPMARFSSYKTGHRVPPDPA